MGNLTRRWRDFDLMSPLSRVAGAQNFVEGRLIDTELLQNPALETSVLGAVARDDCAKRFVSNFLGVDVVLGSPPQRPTVKFNESTVLVLVNRESPPEEKLLKHRTAVGLLQPRHKRFACPMWLLVV